MPNFGGQEIFLFLVIALLLFGGKKLPDLARGLGQSLRIFKSEVKSTEEKTDNSEKPEEK